MSEKSMLGGSSVVSVKELHERGKSLRETQPLAGLGTGFRTDRDPVAILDAQNATRIQSLVPVRWAGWHSPRSPSIAVPPP